ncbi:chemotaxis protein CheW [Magnetospirillum sp. UT-4]|uniref:chemotaxis protein CheW n=1 Tax=Magnetospirillum sp. UT-4 TaxID=2681467 RepID=UPI0020C56DE6|nr:chemotaxis protein CheW [Magnetospirillum sp. UT-4]
MPGISASEPHSFVVFRVGCESFALAVDVVREVVPYCQLARPPQLPAVVEGVLNLGGAAVPVLRADLLLGLGKGVFGLDASILVMRPGAEGEVGLLVHHVEAVRPAVDFRLLPVADDTSFQGCLAGELDDGGASVHFLDWTRMLMEEERRRLGEFRERAEARLAAWVEPGS